ncbi:MAG TPA: hypothetical protein VNN19_10855 [bacterium]|nr:hypothetical protein [bacterium]
MRTLIVIAAVLALATLVVAPAAPAQGALENARRQLQTAIFHSGELAQRGSAVAASKTHLQHTLNCLEGPRGQNFNAAPGNPCQGQGNGIIPDLRAAEAAGAGGAGSALRFATAAHTLILTALQSNDVDLVQPYAKVVSDQLRQALAATQ